MSHRRSFAYMTRDELELKRLRDELDHELINRGVRDSFRQHGRVGGLDEAVRTATLKATPGKREYLEEQMRLNDEELAKRQDEPISPDVQRILDLPRTPARHTGLTHHRRRKRRERIKLMRKKGRTLYGNERPAYLRQRMTDFADGVSGFANGVSSFAGGIVDGARKNFLALALLASLASSCVGGVQWARKGAVYDGVVAEYVKSSEVAPDVLPLKRTIPEEITYAKMHLTYVPETRTRWTDEDGNTQEFVTPEKRSDPDAAQRNIRDIETQIRNHLSDEVIGPYKEVTESDKDTLRARRHGAVEHFRRAYRSLDTAIATDVSYPSEMRMLEAGNDEIQRAVGVMEHYVPLIMRQKEEKAYSAKSFWKWWTIISGVVSGLMAFNIARGTRRRSYGY